MNLLVVLSHLMSEELVLGDESAARAELAIKLFLNNEFDQLVTLGWDYRSDCSVAIADVVRDYIIKHSDIDENSIAAIKSSRDTVGDAIYCLEYFSDKRLTKIKVVTSDYHVNRTKTIFDSVSAGSVPIEVVGVNTGKILDQQIQLHEQESIEAFWKTFTGVDFSSRSQVFAALANRHPFYNGVVHPRISDHASFNL